METTNMSDKLALIGITSFVRHSGEIVAMKCNRCGVATNILSYCKIHHNYECVECFRDPCHDRSKTWGKGGIAQ